MVYLQKLINRMYFIHSLRCYSPAQILTRTCTRDYKVPGFPQITIKEEDELYVNVTGIHMDPEYYPEPQKFIPERFSKEERSRRDP